jgi:hypothetical protein
VQTATLDYRMVSRRFVPSRHAISCELRRAAAMLALGAALCRCLRASSPHPWGAEGGERGRTARPTGSAWRVQGLAHTWLSMSRSSNGAGGAPRVQLWPKERSRFARPACFCCPRRCAAA